MKKTFHAIACMLIVALAPTMHAASRPDITDLLKSAAEKAKGGSDDNSGSTALSGLKGLAEGLLTSSKVGEDDLVGNWRYNAPAVTFKSDNLLQKAGGSAASGVIVEKIAPYYEKAGITSLTATFNQDRTFELKVKKITLTGTYALAGDEANGDFVFNFKAVKKLPLGKMNAHRRQGRQQNHTDIRCIETDQTGEHRGTGIRKSLAAVGSQTAQLLRRPQLRVRAFARAMIHPV